MLVVKGGLPWRTGVLSCALKGESKSTREKLNGESRKGNTGQDTYGIFKELKESPWGWNIGNKRGNARWCWEGQKRPDGAESCKLN